MSGTVTGVFIKSILVTLGRRTFSAESMSMGGLSVALLSLSEESNGALGQCAQMELGKIPGAAGQKQ